MIIPLFYIIETVLSPMPTNETPDRKHGTQSDKASSKAPRSDIINHFNRNFPELMTIQLHFIGCFDILLNSSESSHDSIRPISERYAVNKSSSGQFCLKPGIIDIHKFIQRIEAEEEHH